MSAVGGRGLWYFPRVVKQLSDATKEHARATAESAIDRVRERGQRVTTARRVVIEALAHDGGHPTADDLSVTIALRHPGVHRATVYRTLETLAEMGVVAHVHFGQGAAVYHLIESPRERAHLHAVCLRCGVVVDLPGSLMDSVAIRVRDELGFEIMAAHHALSGVCRQCRDSSEG